MFRSRLAKVLLLGSLTLSCGCCGERPYLFERFRHHGNPEGCCGEVSGFPTDGPILQEYGPYPPGGAPITTVPGGGPAPTCPTLVPQGTPLPVLTSPPGVRVDAGSTAPREPYKPLPKE